MKPKTGWKFTNGIHQMTRGTHKYVDKITKFPKFQLLESILYIVHVRMSRMLDGMPQNINNLLIKYISNSQITYRPGREWRHVKSEGHGGEVESKAVPRVCNILQRLTGDPLVEEILFSASWLQGVIVKLNFLTSLYLYILCQLCELHDVLKREGLRGSRGLGTECVIRRRGRMS